MDVELVVPLLRWVESATVTQLRRAAQAAAQHQAMRLITNAVAQSVTLVLPTANAIAASEDGTPSAPAVAADGILALPAAVQPHVLQFVQDTVENLTQLTNFLLTEQLSESIDSASVLRKHVSGLIHSGNRELLLLLHAQFCGKMAFAGASTSIHFAIEPQKVHPHQAPQPQSDVLSDERSQTSAFAPITPVALDEDAAAAEAAEADSSAAPPPPLPTSSASSPSAASPAPTVLADASSSLSPLLSPSSTSGGSSFLQSSGGHTDLLCLVLSYVGVWPLLCSASRVCMRWLSASMDPRCFRQITQLAVTQFMDPPDPPRASNEWAWPPTAQAAPAFSPPTEAAYAAFTLALSKLGNLHRLEFGPKTPDRALAALGRGVSLPLAPSAAPFLAQLRSLSLRNCDAITDEGLRALVGACTHAVKPAASALSSSPPSFTAAPSLLATTATATTPHCIMHALVILDVSGCRRVTDRGLSALVAHLPALRHADFSLCPGLGLITLQTLARSCPRITRLSLAGARNVDDNCLRAIAGGGGGSGSGCGLMHLRSLSIEDCWNVTPTGLLALANGCRSLQQLNCSGTYNAVGEVAFLPLVTRCAATLQQLDFTGCPLTDAGVRVLMYGSAEGPSGSGSGGLQQLTSLRMSMLGRMGPSAGELSDVAIAAIAHSPTRRTLHTLDVTGCAKLTDRAVALIAEHCEQMQTLTLSRCSGLTDSSIISLGSVGVIARTLLSLDVSHVYQLTDASIDSLLRLRALRQLNLKKCLRLTDAVWSLLQPRKSDSSASAGPNTMLPLEALDLSGCKITDHGIRQLHLARRHATQRSPSSEGERALPSLASLASSEPSSSLEASFLLRQGLQSLALNECHTVGDEGLSVLLPLCPRLTSISLVGCHRITNATLLTMARCNPSLRTVLLHQCVELTNEGVEHLCTRLPGLYELGLDELSQLSNSALLAVAAHCPHLQRLSVTRAPHITFHAVHALLVRCPDLQQLNCALAAQLTALAPQHADAQWQAVQQMVARRGVQFLR